jgi:predicted PurR-regulated permease PerM
MKGSGIKVFFAKNWERILLWVILIGLFYLLKPFFLLIFETFLITYISRGIILWLEQRFSLNYKVATCGVFIIFIAFIISISMWIGPQLVRESNQLIVTYANKSANQTMDDNGYIENTIGKILGEERGQALIDSEQYEAFIKTIKTDIKNTVKSSLPKVFESIIYLIKLSWSLVISFILAILFSFILVMDWNSIASKMKRLEHSRIRSFYQATAPHMQSFSTILGKAFRAQAIITACNMIFTATGLYFLGVPNIALLSTIVFFCGFIPILGTFISSVPILLFGIQFGGLIMGLKLIGLIAFIHAIEAYILNPKITANVLRVHPIIILILLLIGEKFFGIWGMVVGVPVGFYIISVLTQPEKKAVLKNIKR